jgi:nucleotide-binding universal stress UspA family protein
MKLFNSILYVVEDPSTESGATVARAVSLAENSQAKLTVLHVAEEPRLGPFAGSVTVNDFKSRVSEQATAQLAALIRGVDKDADFVVDVRFGTAVVEVIREVLRNHHDLVIKQVGKGGAHSFLFGGIDQHLLRQCPCPVWIMVGDTSANYQRILAAVDFDPWEEGDGDDKVEGSLNRQILDIAGMLAVSDFAQLHVVHAWEAITDNMIRVFGSELSDNEVAGNRDRERREHQSRLDILDRRMQQHFGGETHRYLAPRFHLRKGAARDVVPAVAGELKADLVVMGTVSRTGIPALLIGNTAEVILNNLECSVLAVKPEGFVTPVTLD